MRIVMLVRRDSEYSSEAADWVRDYQHETGETVEELDPDSIEGEMFATAHDFVQYPTLAVLDQDNRVLQHWSGSPLPSLDKVKYVTRTI